MSASQYWELRVCAPEDISEGLTNFVWELGALGVVEEESPVAGAWLRAFFPASTSAETLRARLADYLDGLRTLGYGVVDDPQIARVADPGWAEAWRGYFRPLRVGDHLLVVPPWEIPQTCGEVVIVIEPGRAFGTGHHGTTAGCLELLEQAVARDRPGRAVDLGTGSGILAIAAARLGTGEIVAIDDDPDAVANARINIAHNGVGDQVTCALGEASTLAVHPVPLVLANLLVAAHQRLASTYRRLLMPGGTLILGGILEPEVDHVDKTLGRLGFARGAAITRQEWTTLALTAGR
ncbi:MAG: 50S ribosomal protein L11 methyltransferase [Candidatus Rokuibacteriota bacterium]